MELKKQLNKVSVFFSKYKYVALVLLIGLVLMAIPTKTENESNVQPPNTPEQNRNESVADQLSNLLSTVDGAGRVKVMLTIASGEETEFQTDQNNSGQENVNTSQTKTIIVTDAQRNESGLIRKVNPPVYQGAVIVCQGADSPTVRLAIVDAVSKVTGLGSDKISILKMK